MAGVDVAAPHSVFAQIATAYSMAKLLSAIPLTIAGHAKIVIYDIHALQERFYFNEKYDHAAHWPSALCLAFAPLTPRTA